MIIEIFLAAWQNIIANKIRTFLTIIGIVIGIASVIAISGLGEGSKKSINENLSKLGTNKVTIGMNYRGNIVQRDRFTNRDEELLRNYPEITYLSPVYNMDGRFEKGSDYYEVSLRGINQEFDKIELVDMMYGSYISEEDLKSATNLIVIDNLFAKLVFEKEDVVGEKIKIKVGKYNRNFFIKGVYKNASEGVDSMFSRNFRAISYVPITATEKLDARFRIQSYQAIIKDINNLETVSTDITKLLEIKHNNFNKYFVESAFKRMESVTSVLTTMTLFVSFVASISLFVGGIGVMNIMLVSVTERTKEIGICKSLGASNSDILLQFLIEAVILCLAGGIIGITLGFGLSTVLGNMVKIKPFISLSSVLMAVCISTAAGVIFGVYPASKASKLNPIDALRYE